MSMYPIATQTLTGTSAQVIFDNIPQTFTHLRLVMFARSNGGSGTNIPIRFNNDSGGNYRVHYFGGSGSSAFSGDFGATQTIGDVGWVGAGTDTANSWGCSVVDVLDYTNTNKFKTLRATNGVIQTTSTGAGLLGIWTSLWNSTAAITRFDFFLSSGSFVAGSTFSLYGIATSTMTGA